MKRSALLGRRSYFDMVHSITLRIIETLSDTDLDFRPQPDMRATSFNISTACRNPLRPVLKLADFSQEIENANIPESSEGQAVSGGLKTIADCVAFAKECHQIAGNTLSELSDGQLTANIEAPFGTFPAWQYFNFMYDEHWHHRGQLYTYVRLLGKKPPMLYDYQPS